MQYGVCVFRNTGLDDAGHIEFSKRIGDLDTMRRYMTDGRRPRYGFYELFDAGNIDDQGGVLDPNSPRAQYGKVFISCLFHRASRRLTAFLLGQRPFSCRLLLQPSKSELLAPPCRGNPSSREWRQHRLCRLPHRLGRARSRVSEGTPREGLYCPPLNCTVSQIGSSRLLQGPRSHQWRYHGSSPPHPDTRT